MYYLYIAQCADKSLYTGITTDLKRRMNEHNASVLGAKYTRARKPVRLVYKQRFPDRSGSSQEEARIKSLSRLEKIKLIKQARKKYPRGFSSSSTPSVKTALVGRLFLSPKSSTRKKQTGYHNSQSNQT